MKYIVIDIETTGLYPERGDRIIEIAALPILDNELSINNSYNQLINPGINIPKNIVNLVHITDTMVKDAPSLKEVLPSFLSYIKNYPLIAHNASFDIGFLNFYLNTLNLNTIKNRVIDTMVLSKEVFDNEKSHSLDAVAKRLGIELKTIQRHRALGDVILTAKVFLKLRKML